MPAGQLRTGADRPQDQHPRRRGYARRNLLPGVAAHPQGAGIPAVQQRRRDRPGAHEERLFGAGRPQLCRGRLLGVHHPQPCDGHPQHRRRVAHRLRARGVARTGAMPRLCGLLRPCRAEDRRKGRRHLPQAPQPLHRPRTDDVAVDGRHHRTGAGHFARLALQQLRSARHGHCHGGRLAGGAAQILLRGAPFRCPDAALGAGGRLPRRTRITTPAAAGGSQDGAGRRLCRFHRARPARIVRTCARRAPQRAGRHLPRRHRYGHVLCFSCRRPRCHARRP